MRERPFTLRASSSPAPSSRGLSEEDIRVLIDAFARRLDPNLVRDVAASCDDVERALKNLNDMAPAPVARAREPAHPQVFGGNVPDDVRDVIFRSLRASDAGATSFASASATSDAPARHCCSRLCAFARCFARPDDFLRRHCNSESCAS